MVIRFYAHLDIQSGIHFHFGPMSPFKSVQANPGFLDHFGSRFSVIMADGRIPLRELVTNQNRGQLEILLAAGTSIQLENLKSKVPIGR